MGPLDDIKQTQTYLLQMGFPIGTADGVWGPKSIAALNNLLKSTLDPSKPQGVNKVCWGRKFTLPDIVKLAWIVKQLNLTPDNIQNFMGCMAWETGEAFRPDTRSPVSSGTGLIQFMKATAEGMGTTTLALSKMTVNQQLDYVYKYFLPYKGKLKSLGDLYAAIIWPAAIGKDDSFVLWEKGKAPAQYLANAGLDINKDSAVTKLECLHKVNNKLVKGLLPQYVMVF